MLQLVASPPPDAEQRRTAYVGMTILMAGWTMMFGVMFFVYGALRISADAWPPLGLPMLPIAVPTLSTLVMIASSAAFEFGLFRIRKGHAGSLAPSITVAALLGLLFCWLQWSVGASLFDGGMTFDRGPYAAVFFGFSIIHAGHVLIGILALIGLALRAGMGAYSTPRHLAPRLWAVYWHFVGVVWLAIYLLIIVL